MSNQKQSKKKNFDQKESTEQQFGIIVGVILGIALGVAGVSILVDFVR